MMGLCAAKRRLHGELMGFFNRQSGVFLVLAAAMLWGTSGTAQRFAPGGYDPLVIGALLLRSEERRVGKECRSRWSPYH